MVKGGQEETYFLAKKERQQRKTECVGNGEGKMREMATKGAQRQGE